MLKQFLEKTGNLINMIRQDLHILESGCNDFDRLFADKERSRFDNTKTWSNVRVLVYPLSGINKLTNKEQDQFVKKLIKDGRTKDELARLGFGISSKDQDMLVCFAW